MKAVMLAAGEGLRLRPLTVDRPKPMLQVAGAPVLEHNVRLAAAHGFHDIVINLHHCPEAITSHFQDGGRFGVRITYSYESELLGTAGALTQMRNFLSEDFLVVYADNLSTCNLTELFRLHKERGAALTMALSERDDPRASGIVALDDRDQIVRFLEKPGPDQVFSRLVNAGYLVVHPSVLRLVDRTGPMDLAHDVFPRLLERDSRLYGYRMTEPMWWIDSAEDYKRTCEELRDTNLSGRIIASGLGPHVSDVGFSPERGAISADA